MFSDKISHIFHISAQNIDCGYSLEPQSQGVLLFYSIKMGFKGVKIIMVCFRDDICVPAKIQISLV